MTLHLIYRSYGGENMKSRPTYYSKILTLLSFVRAASALPQVDVIFVNDGPVPSERLEVMRRYGRIRQLGPAAQGLRYSYRSAIEMAAHGPWEDNDTVAFIEDDYLFMESAFVSLAAAVDHLPEISYFSLYGSRPDPADPSDRIEYALPRGWEPAPDQLVGDKLWFNQVSITSTFAARLAPLRADLDIFWKCLGPFRKRFFDHETCLLYQAIVPYHGREFFFGLPGDFVKSFRGILRAVVLIPFRLRLNERARRQDQAHLLYALTPNLATHVEHPLISPDQDWAAVAVDVLAWARENHLPVSAVGNELRADPK